MTGNLPMILYNIVDISVYGAQMVRNKTFFENLKRYDKIRSADLHYCHICLLPLQIEHSFQDLQL